MITLRQLARMRADWRTTRTRRHSSRHSSLTRTATFTPQELLGYAFAEPMPFRPAKPSSNSNTNTVLLGLVVEKLSRQSLPDYIKDHILTPLGMDQHEFSHH